jgi:signal transduction histidine kinase
MEPSGLVDGQAGGTARAVAIGSAVLTVLVATAATVFLVLSWSAPQPPTQFGPRGFTIAFALTMGAVGFVVAGRRPSNPIGWIFCVLGVVSAVASLGTEYALWALVEEGGRPPGGAYGAWLEEWGWIPLVGTLGFVGAIFPDGRFLSRRWRIAITFSLAGAATATVANALTPRLTIYEGVENPFGVGGDGMAEFAQAAIGLMLPLVVLGAVGAIVRFRRSSGDERQQLKWLALAVSAVALCITLYGGIALATGGENPEGADWAENLIILSFLAVPISIGFGVLKYRLYDIDVVINRALVYGALALFVTLVYVSIVVGVGAAVGSRGNSVLSAVAAAVVALAFQPARRRAQHLTNRLVYGKRATPYEVLSQFTERVAESYSVDDVLPRMARIIGEGTGAVRVQIWLNLAGGFRPEAEWPFVSEAAAAVASLEELPDHAVEVRHQGEPLGAITVAMPQNEAMNPVQVTLLRDVAAQAGLLLRNVALVEDLRASRQRLVTAQDKERRRIERDIHDGAQQQLVALSVQLRILEQLIERDPAAAAATAARLQGAATTALEDLRDLARGIYPPLLADQGLAAALESQVRKSPTPVTVEADGVGRLAREVEAAVYFCCLEALQNVTKYANASQVHIRLQTANRHVSFVVEDDGVGFDPRSARGSGLTNMRDRVEALGGSLEVRSAPGEGTSVSGRIPVRDDA